MSHAQQVKQMQSGPGFVAALDQSGGSTPKALGLYGVGPDAFSNDDEMFDLIHAMRSRIVAAPDFNGNKVIAAILFEQTMDREMGGKPTAQHLWDDYQVVPFLKVDKGLEEAADGVKLMKPMPGLSDMLTRARDKGVFGTKMRSVIDAASASGIAANVGQQFEVGAQILDRGLVPIIEPEVTISIADTAEAEAMLLDQIGAHLDSLPADQQVMLKLTLPEVANLYRPLIDHPRVMRVVALSGGYDRAEANSRLAQNNGMIASFSRALAEGLSADQDDAAFNQTIGETIDSIYRASIT